MSEIPTHPLENDLVRAFLGPTDASLRCAECNNGKSKGGKSFIFYRNPITGEPTCGSCLPPIELPGRGATNYCICENCGKSSGNVNDGIFWDDGTNTLMCSDCIVVLYGPAPELYSFGFKNMQGNYRRKNQRGSKQKHASLVRCVRAFRNYILKDLALHANTGNRAVFKKNWHIQPEFNEELMPIPINVSEVYAATTPAQIEKICADIRWKEQSAQPAV